MAFPLTLNFPSSKDENAFLAHCYEVFVSLISSVAAQWNIYSKVTLERPLVILHIAFTREMTS